MRARVTDLIYEFPVFLGLFDHLKVTLLKPRDQILDNLVKSIRGRIKVGVGV